MQKASQPAVANQHLIRTDVCQLRLVCKIKAQILMKNTYVFIVIACIAFGACLHRYNIIIIYKIVIILIVICSFPNFAINSNVASRWGSWVVSMGDVEFSLS